MMWGMMLLWGGLIVLILWLVCQLFPSPSQSGSTERDLGPLEILAHRYARGEISREEYEVMREEIEQAMEQKS